MRRFALETSDVLAPIGKLIVDDLLSIDPRFLLHALSLEIDALFVFLDQGVLVRRR